LTTPQDAGNPPFQIARGGPEHVIAKLAPHQAPVSGLSPALRLTLAPDGRHIATLAAATIAEIVRVTDPLAYATSVLLIVAACLLAAWIPATRAARLDPMQTLRQE
jgi:ABC-type lipoprotein release transport system permease subunit